MHVQCPHNARTVPTQCTYSVHTCSAHINCNTQSSPAFLFPGRWVKFIYEWREYSDCLGIKLVRTVDWINNDSLAYIKCILQSSLIIHRDCPNCNFQLKEQTLAVHLDIFTLNARYASQNNSLEKIRKCLLIKRSNDFIFVNLRRELYGISLIRWNYIAVILRYSSVEISASFISADLYVRLRCDMLTYWCWYLGIRIPQ